MKRKVIIRITNKKGEEFTNNFWNDSPLERSCTVCVEIGLDIIPELSY